MKQGLSLPGPAMERPLRTIRSKLRNVTLHGAPPLDLSLVVKASAAHVVAAVPLEPAAGIFVIDPTLLLPN
jgi:hypothetical protein